MEFSRSFPVVYLTWRSSSWPSCCIQEVQKILEFFETKQVHCSSHFIIVSSYEYAGFTMAKVKLKCQEQSMLAPVPIKEPINPKGKKAFQAKVTNYMPAGYSTETIIDGKVLHGIVFTSDISSDNADENSKRRNGAVELDDVTGVNMEAAAPRNTSGAAIADALRSNLREDQLLLKSTTPWYIMVLNSQFETPVDYILW